MTAEQTLPKRRYLMAASLDLGSFFRNPTRRYESRETNSMLIKIIRRLFAAPIVVRAKAMKRKRP
jgi:hypothetical protein